jgi:hypothetical protein
VARPSAVGAARLQHQFQTAPLLLADPDEVTVASTQAAEGYPTTYASYLAALVRSWEHAELQYRTRGRDGEQLTW